MSKSPVPQSVLQLADSIASLPGIGPKSAFKLAVFLCGDGKRTAEVLVKNLSHAKGTIQMCKWCNNLAEDELCPICEDGERVSSTLMVVETVADLIQVHESAAYNGLYFVTHGLISPMSGVTPQSLKLAKLIAMIEHYQIEEVIFGLNSGVEAEATTMYLIQQLQELDIEYSQLARGLPAGGSIEYLDHRTISGALESRKKIS